MENTSKPQKNTPDIDTGNDKKLTKFMQAITAYAEEQSDAIHREVEAFKEARLNKAEQEVLRESYVLIQREQDEMRRTLSREMSMRTTARRRELLEKRQRMMNDLFARAKQQLVAYTETPAYLDALKASLAAMTALLPAEGTVYALAPHDAAGLAALTPLCPAGSRVETSADIEVGGLRGTNLAAGMVADDTLDSRLEQQHDWFTDHSGLTIE